MTRAKSREGLRYEAVKQYTRNVVISGKSGFVTRSKEEADECRLPLLSASLLTLVLSSSSLHLDADADAMGWGSVSREVAFVPSTTLEE